MSIEAAILIIGDEILSGRTIDTNTQMIASKLLPLGIPIKGVRVVPDEESQILHHLGELKNMYSYVFTTGGIGGTHDDITSACIAKLFNRRLIQHPIILDEIQHFCKDPNDASIKMSFIPEGADVQLIQNSQKFISTYMISNIFVLAGMPSIASLMMEEVVKKLPKCEPIVMFQKDFVIGEDKIAYFLEKLQEKYPSLSIGSYPYEQNHIGTVVVIKGVAKDGFTSACHELSNYYEELFA